jgi:hypothetical protein
MPTVAVMLPPSDVEAGQQAFLGLRCTACRAVPSEPDFPAPVCAHPGPPIDARLASRDVSYLMASIMTPSHAISTKIGDEVRARLSGVLSPMGDFSRVMTVRSSDSELQAESAAASLCAVPPSLTVGISADPVGPSWFETRPHHVEPSAIRTEQANCTRLRCSQIDLARLSSVPAAAGCGRSV